MSEAIERLNSIVGEVIDLHHAASVLTWDERVYMPPGGAETRSLAVATVRKLAHERFTSTEVGDLLEDAKAAVAGDPASEGARLVAVTARDYDKATRVPASFVAEQAKVTSAAQHAWQQARAGSDFALFAPHLARIVELKREYVSFFPPAAHPYDTLLDDYEHGFTTADVQAVFDALRPRQVALIRQVAECPPVSDRLLRLDYTEQPLWDFGVEAITAFGFDWRRGRQDKSAHPYTSGSGSDDIRITTRFDRREPFTTIFATLHEAGHGLYEQGVDQRWRRTSFEGGTSLAIHESQSRLWENLVGRSRPFWEHFWPSLQRRCPAQLGDASLEEFYRAINRIQPSCIRVEADETTYNLHVMLRVEMEVGMLADAVSVNDLPDLWNTKMQEYLGIVPPDDAHGILQDVHWSIGLMGYFATYTLGNVISVQLWERLLDAEPSRDELIQRGDFAPILEWLRREIHQHGRRYEPQDLLQRVTGSRIDPQPYLRYLEQKVADVYGLTHGTSDLLVQDRPVSTPAADRLLLAGFAVTRAYLLLFHVHLSTDLKIYRGWLQQVASGLTPYVSFPIEDPPLAWWVIQLPGTSDRLPYYFRFRLLMGVADVASFALLWWIAAKRRRSVSRLVVATYLLTTLSLEPLLYDRLDLPMLMLMLAAFAAWLEAAESTRPGAWRTAAYVMVGLGASYRLIPIVILPFLILADLRMERRWLPVALRTLLCLVALSLPFAISYPAAGTETLGFLRYHVARGLEIESTWASLMWLTSPAGDALHVIHNAGSWELSGSLDATYARMASGALVLLLAGFGLWALALGQRFDARRAYLHMVLVPVTLLTVVNVFSAQYLLWALPLLMLAAIEVLERTRALAIVAVCCVAIGCLTTAFFPLGARYVDDMNPWIMTILAVRNAMYVGLVGWIVWQAVAKDFRRSY